MQSNPCITNLRSGGLQSNESGFSLKPKPSLFSKRKQIDTDEDDDSNQPPGVANKKICSTVIKKQSI